MKILLYNPVMPSAIVTLPLGLLQLGVLLRHDDHSLRYIDGNMEPDGLPAAIKEFGPDLVAITSVTSAIPDALAFAGSVKTVSSSIPVIIGGPHASVDCEGMLQHREIDAVVVGEGEKAIRLIAERANVAALAKGELPQGIPGLYCRTPDGGIAGGEPNPVLTPQELDDLPAPDFSLVDMELYFRKAVSHGLYIRGKRIVPIMTSRGCPQRCTFCGHAMGHRFRPLSVGRVVEQVRELVDRYQIDALDIEDDNFTLNRARALELLEALAPFRLHLRMANGVRADRVDRELLRAFRKAGGYSIVFGIESGSPRVLSMMKKDIALEHVVRAVQEAREEGFLVGGNWIIGYPGETMEDFKESFRFFKRLDLDSSAIVNLIPFPGTAVYELCRQEGYLTEESKDWGNYYYSINDPIPLIETPWMDREKLNKLTKKAYYSVYFRPKRVWQILRNGGLQAISRGFLLFIRGLSQKKSLSTDRA